MRRSRALAAGGVACLAALVVAGCGTSGSSSSSSTVKITGNTLTLYIGSPTDTHGDPVVKDVVDAEQLAFKQLHGEVKDFRLKLFTLTGKTASDNARGAIIDKTAIAYLGEAQAGVSDQSVGITNALDLLQVSPTDNALELSDSTPAVNNTPKAYFESWGTYGRTFARMLPSGSQEALLLVQAMAAKHVKSLYISSDGSDYGRAIADAVASDAHKQGIAITKSRSGADAVFDGAMSPTAAASFFKQAAAAAPSATLYGPSALDSGAFAAAAGSLANLYVTVPGIPSSELTPAGKRFDSDFKATYGHAPDSAAIFGYAAMQAVLHVLKEAGTGAGNRTTVVDDFLNQRKVSGVLGTYSINSGGNISIPADDAFMLAHPQGGKLVPVKRTTTVGLAKLLTGKAKTSTSKAKASAAK